MTAPRTIWQHVAEGLDAVAAAAMRAPGADQTIVDDWRQGPHDFIVEAVVDQRADGRIDNRSLLFSVTTSNPGSPNRYEVARVRARDLVDEDGQPIDARATARDLLVQLQPVPDDISSLGDGA